METISSALAGRPWPEFLPDRRPALLVPASPGRLLILSDGWTDRDSAPTRPGRPNPYWRAVLDDSRLVIHRPGRELWLDSEISANSEWRRAVQEHRTLLMITGPFANPFQFPAAADAGQVFILTTEITVREGR